MSPIEFHICSHGYELCKYCQADTNSLLKELSDLKEANKILAQQGDADFHKYDLLKKEFDRLKSENAELREFLADRLAKMVALRSERAEMGPIYDKLQADLAASELSRGRLIQVLKQASLRCGNFLRGISPPFELPMIANTFVMIDAVKQDCDSTISCEPSSNVYEAMNAEIAGLSHALVRTLNLIEELHGESYDAYKHGNEILKAPTKWYEALVKAREAIAYETRLHTKPEQTALYCQCGLCKALTSLTTVLGPRWDGA